jgi:DNA-binding transcriptional MerR regulator
VERYSPGQAAEQTGFSLDTLRYYERIGLLDAVARTPGGQRIFTDDDLGWLGLLRCLRDTGMPIAGMQRYAELARGGDDTIAERLALLEEHDRAIQQQVAHLRAQQQHIREKIRWYRSVSPQA